MLQGIKTLLSQPYPYFYRSINLLVFALIIFGMSVIFNFVFEPFVVYRPEHKMSYFWISIIHSLNAFIIIILVVGSLNKVLNEEKWKVWKEILLYGALLLIIGIGQFFIRDIIYNNPLNWSWQYFFEEIKNTFLAGILFVIILVPLNYIRLNRRNFASARKLNSKPLEDKSSSEEDEVLIVTQLKSEEFVLNVKELLVAKAEGNYLELILKDGEGTKIILKRMTLKELEAQLKEYPQFLRTHRSYLLNLQTIRNVKGNAQGYQVAISNYDNEIPVSRGIIPRFEEKFK